MPSTPVERSGKRHQRGLAQKLDVPYEVRTIRELGKGDIIFINAYVFFEVFMLVYLQF